MGAYIGHQFGTQVMHSMFSSRMFDFLLSVLSEKIFFIAVFKYLLVSKYFCELIFKILFITMKQMGTLLFCCIQNQNFVVIFFLSLKTFKKILFISLRFVERQVAYISHHLPLSRIKIGPVVTIKLCYLFCLI